LFSLPRDQTAFLLISTLSHEEQKGDVGYFTEVYMKSKRIMWGVVSLVVLITVAVSFGAFESSGREDGLQQPEITPTWTPTPEIKDTRDLSKYGSVDYSKTPEDPSSARFSVNKRYDDQGWVYKLVHPVTAGVGRITDDPPPPPFPMSDGILIVVGDVISVNAFLSNDRGGVYTELTIRIDELLKNSESGKAAPQKVMADREGGIVVYPNGQRVMYQSSERGLPLLGSRYLFFLKKNGPSPNYEIIASYDITGDQIYHMEKGAVLEEINDSTRPAFLENIRNKIARHRGP
jgi:hypothetical protein